MPRIPVVACVCLAASLMTTPVAAGEGEPVPRHRVLRTEDFAVTGNSETTAWQKTPWVPLNRRGDGKHDYSTRFKMLYSDRGLYVLLDGADSRLSAKMSQDFLNLWTEDVFEFFLWPDSGHSTYFEYEISPLGYELPLLIPNFNGRFLGWLPWHYEGERKTRKAVTVRGGDKATGATITGWIAEVFVPYELLSPLPNVPPRSGSTWRANVYRVDYDGGHTTSWDWARVGPSFHDFDRFGHLIFE